MRFGHPLGLFRNLVDKIIFAVAAIIGLQIPNFLGQYRQRLAGHYDESQRNLEGFKAIGESSIGTTDLQTLVSHYQQGNEDLQLIANKIADDLARSNKLGELLVDLTIANVWGRLKHLLFDLDAVIARATLNDYQLGLPLTAEALLYALVFGLVATFIFNWLLYLFGSINNAMSGRDVQGYRRGQHPDKVVREQVREAQKTPEPIFYPDSTKDIDPALVPKSKMPKQNQRGFEQISQNIREQVDSNDET